MNFSEGFSLFSDTISIIGMTVMVLYMVGVVYENHFS